MNVALVFVFTSNEFLQIKKKESKRPMLKFKTLAFRESGQSSQYLVMAKGRRVLTGETETVPGRQRETAEELRLQGVC